jgi:hypothetical protein
MSNLVTGLVWLFSGLLIFVHLSLATSLSYGLNLLAVLECLVALLLILVALISMSRRRSVSRLLPLILAFLSPTWIVSYYPCFINQRVARVGAKQLVQDATALCQWKTRACEEQGLIKTQRIIAPGIEWRTWSAP